MIILTAKLPRHRKLTIGVAVAALACCAALVLTLASSRTHRIARIVLAMGLTAVPAMVRLSLYMPALYSAGVFSRSATRSSSTPDPIELRMPTMKSTMRGLPSTGRGWRTGPRRR